MITPEIDVNTAARIVIPSGRDYERCLEAFEAEFGVTAPRFDDRLLTRQSGMTRYTKVKGKDIPAYVANGSADIGLTGTDVCEEQIPEDTNDSNLLYKAIGAPMCTFNLLLPDKEVDTLVARLNDPEAAPVQIATGYPRFLWRCMKRAQAADQTLNIAITQLKPSGSVEALPGWITEAVADIVETGETALANGLAIGPKLADIYPAVVWRDPTKPAAPLNRNSFGVDTTIGERVQQKTDQTVSSYTIERLRNPNQALKDYGEESAEFLEAVIRGSDSAANELADLLFASLVLSRANGGNVTLAKVVQILETRNTATSFRQKA